MPDGFNGDRPQHAGSESTAVSSRARCLRKSPPEIRDTVMPGFREVEIRGTLCHDWRHPESCRTFRTSYGAPPVKSRVNPLCVSILSDVQSGPGGTVATERVQRRAHLLSGSGAGVVSGPVTLIPRSGMRRSKRLGSIFVPVPPQGGLPKYESITQPPGLLHRPNGRPRKGVCGSQATSRAPVGTRPFVANRHRAINSLRATATMARLRARP